MTTDEMILDLVTKHGFRLPVWLNLELVLPPIAVAGKHYWTVNSEPVAEDEIGAIHDLCAAEFARQAAKRQHDMFNRSAYADPDERQCWADYTAARIDSDSPAAIKALWEALQ